jgi:hypothetical protein
MPYRLISEQMLLEHEVLARLADALRTAIGWSHHGGVSGKLESVRFLVESFQRHMERMFDLEEQDGYLELVARSHPQLDPQLKQFRAEHDEFRRRVHEALARMQELVAAGHAEIDPLLAEITLLLEQIDGHNKREMRLLQEMVLEPKPGDS